MINIMLHYLLLILQFIVPVIISIKFYFYMKDRFVKNKNIQLFEKRSD